MAAKIRELSIELACGATLLVDVATIDEVSEIIKDLTERGLIGASAPPPPKRAIQHDDSKNREDEREANDSPESRIETRAAIESGRLKKSRLLAFKDEQPQLLQPGKFAAVSDAVMALIYSIEHGLKQSSIAFDPFKSIFDSQNIKSGSPLSMILNNMRKSGYIDDKVYLKDRLIRLSPKGDEKAAEILRAAVS